MRKITKLFFLALLLLLIQGCAAYNALTNTFDDSNVPDAGSAAVLE